MVWREARRGVTAGLFFAAGFWSGLLLMSNYDFLGRIKQL